jgi:hypothetical protein
MRCIKPLGIVSALAFSATLAHAGAVKTDDETVYRPTGKGHGELDDSPGAVGRARAAAKSRGPNNGINYNGGPVMTDSNGVNVYYIWYGNWSSNAIAQTILTELAQNLAPSGRASSPWWNISTTYTQGTATNSPKIANVVSLSGIATVGNYPQGTALSDAAIRTVVTNAISSSLPKDPNGVYFVLTSADVNATSGFCTQYCGWHTHATIGGTDIKYAFVGNPDRCPSACAAQSTGPNGNAGADGMASIIAHELTEAASDPDLNAWYDQRGYENADKCAWTFGATSGASGAKYNMTLGTRSYLIQQNWVNASGGYCALSY